MVTKYSVFMILNGLISLALALLLESYTLGTVSAFTFGVALVMTLVDIRNH